MMDLRINLPLVDQLNLGWRLLAHHFAKDETDIKRKLIEQYWPDNIV